MPRLKMYFEQRCIQQSHFLAYGRAEEIHAQQTTPCIERHPQQS